MTSHEEKSNFIAKFSTKIGENLSPAVKLNLLAIAVGIVGGLGSLVFRVAIDIIYQIFFIVPMEILKQLSIPFIWLPFLISPMVGGLIVGYLTTRVSTETKGHGVPEVLEAVVFQSGRMHLRVPFIKIIASATTLGTGGSAGREGPIAQIGAGFGSFIGQKLKIPPKELRTLVIAGVAAGIAATFNAPIGGSLFAIEILLGETGTTLFIPIMIAGVVGVITGRLLLGSAPAFRGIPQALEYKDPTLIPLFIGLGILCGLLSALWIKSFYKSEDVIEHFVNIKMKLPPILMPVIGGLVVGIILTLTFLITGEGWLTYTTMGLTYKPMDSIFNGILLRGPVVEIVAILFLLFLLKAIATVFTVGAGGSGGVFAPTLFLGAMLGAAYGKILGQFLAINEVTIVLFAIIGMAGFFSGTGRAPFTSIIMAAEMTNDYLLTIPLMLVVAISYGLSTLIERENIYTLKLIRRGVNLRDSGRKDILDNITIPDAMTPIDKVIAVSPKHRLEEVLDLIKETKHEGFPVLNEDNLVGVVTLSDIYSALEAHPKDWDIGKLLENKRSGPKMVCINETAPLTHAVAIMERYDISRLPVVEKTNGQIKLIGWLTNHDITHAFITAKAENELVKTEEYMVNFPDIIRQ